MKRVVASKVLPIMPTAKFVERHGRASAKRLGIDIIDLYQIHWPEPPEDIEEGWQAVQKLKEEGKVRWCGVSNFSETQMAQWL